MDQKAEIVREATALRMKSNPFYGKQYHRTERIIRFQVQRLLRQNDAEEWGYTIQEFIDALGDPTHTLDFEYLWVYEEWRRNGA